MAFACEVCSVILKTKEGLETHMEIRHIDPVQIFKCPVCSVEHYSKGSMEAHRYQKHTRGSRYLKSPEESAERGELNEKTG